MSAFAVDTSLSRPRRYRREVQRDPRRQALLAELGVPVSAIVTLDAIHCQKPSTSPSRPASADHSGQEQPTNPAPKYRRPLRRGGAAQLSHSHDKARNRDETRTVCVFEPGATRRPRRQGHAKAVIRVQRVVYTRNSRDGLLSRTSETAFYLSNKPVLPAARPRRSARIGRSKRHPTTAATSRSAKTARVSGPIPGFRR